MGIDVINQNFTEQKRAKISKKNLVNDLLENVKIRNKYKEELTPIQKQVNISKPIEPVIYPATNQAQYPYLEQMYHLTPEFRTDFPYLAKTIPVPGEQFTSTVRTSAPLTDIVKNIEKDITGQTKTFPYKLQQPTPTPKRKGKERIGEPGKARIVEPSVSQQRIDEFVQGLYPPSTQGISTIKEEEEEESYIQEKIAHMKQ